MRSRPRYESFHTWLEPPGPVMLSLFIDRPCAPQSAVPAVFSASPVSSGERLGNQPEPRTDLLFTVNNRLLDSADIVNASTRQYQR